MDEAFQVATDPSKYASILGANSGASKQQVTAIDPKNKMVDKAEGAWDVFGN